MPALPIRHGTWLLLAALLWGYALVTAALRFPEQAAVDLYHPWGVPIVHALAPETNPYADTAVYGDALARIAADSGEAKLMKASAHWQPSPNRAEPTGTPFFYATLSFLPDGFGAAHAVMTVLALLSVFAGFTLLARLRGLAPGPALCVSALGAAWFNPFVQDVRYGNVNCLQLGALVALLWVAQRRAWERHAWLDRAYLPLLALLVLFKPNTLLMAAALALHYAAVRGMRPAALSMVPAAAVALVAVLAGAWYFDGIAVWRDWLAYIGGANGGTLLYRLEQGNHSLAMLLAQRGGAYDATGYGIVLGLALALVALAAATRNGREPGAALPVARALMLDAWFMLGAGVVATYMTTPLLWPHYDVFAAIPIAWLLRNGGVGRLGTACAVLAFALQSRPLIEALLALEAFGALRLATLFCWTPLVVGLAAAIAARRRTLPPAPAT